MFGGFKRHFHTLDLPPIGYRFPIPTLLLHTPALRRIARPSRSLHCTQSIANAIYGRRHTYGDVLTFWDET